MTTTALIRKAEQQVKALFEAHPNPGLRYHNIQHTGQVVAAATKIADHYQLDEEDYAAVIIAAWYHDTGYVFGGRELHEEKSVALAEAFIKAENERDTLLEKVSGCILATKIPQSPDSLISRIVCDADLFHLGTGEFKTINKLVRKEISVITGEKFSGEEWRGKTLSFLENHSFHTDYCKTLLQKGKQENIEWLRKKMDEDKPETSAGLQAVKKVTEKPARGIETMFRTTSANHLRLSEMADTKANTMITVNTIIVSILISVFPGKIEEDTRLIIPAVLFLTTSLSSIVLSILVTRPNIVRGVFTKEDIAQKRVNLLFFGNFHKMAFDDYQGGIKAMMQDSEFLYGSMTRDIYNLGRVLGRKYQLLRLAYSLFMIGVTASVIAFVIAMNL